MLTKLDWMGEHYVTFEDWARELNEKYGMEFDVKKMEVLRESQDGCNEMYQRLERRTVIERLREAGYKKASEFLERMFR